MMIITTMTARMKTVKGKMIMVKVKVKIHQIVKVKITEKVKAKAMKIVQVIQIDHVQEEEIRITTPNKNLVAEPEIISIQEIHNFMVICYRTGIKMVMEEVKAHLIILLIIHLIMVKVKKAHLQMIIHMVIIDHHQIVIAIVLQIQICLKILEVIVKMILMKKMKKALKQWRNICRFDPRLLRKERRVLMNLPPCRMEC